MAETAEQNDRVIWRGHPSQVTNLGKNIGALLLIALFLAGGIWLTMRLESYIPLYIGMGLAAVIVAWALFHWLQTRCYKYELTDERLQMQHGVLSRHTEELELYRVHDLKLEEPFWIRLFGLAHIVLYTSDQTAETLRIESIRNAAEIRDKIRDRVEQTRQDKNVRTIEGMEMTE